MQIFFEGILNLPIIYIFVFASKSIRLNLILFEEIKDWISNEIYAFPLS